MNFDGCHALITGASAGIGREFAKQLGGRAELLVLVARREAKLDELREELRQAHPRLRVEIHRADLADENARRELLKWIAAEKLEIDFLINNAGLGDFGSFASAAPEKIERILAVNMIALTQLTRALLPAMIARGCGAILNVSSSAGFLPIPNFAVYAATKAYVTSFSEALRSEVGDRGINVTALCPGPVETEFTTVASRSGRPENPGPAFVRLSAERVVALALKAVEQNRPMIVPGWPMKFGMAVVRLTPMALLRLTSRLRVKLS